MSQNRRHFLQTLSAAGAAATFGNNRRSTAQGIGSSRFRRYQFVQMDVFTSKRLEGNPLSVFPDARGLSDKEMQDLARETNLRETTFVLPRDPKIERERGIKVRIFTPEEEIPFGGHPTLGTAMVLHILQGVEIKRPSHIYVRAGKQGEKIGKACVGGHAVEVIRGEAFL